MLEQDADNMSHHAEQVLPEKMKNNSFSIQADESTDSNSYVVAFVKICKMMVKFKKNYFCCKGQDILNVLSSYLETNYAGIYTDGTPSMSGSTRGFTSCKKKKILTSQHTALFTERC
jgi:hypothetical protein